VGPLENLLDSLRKTAKTARRVAVKKALAEEEEDDEEDADGEESGFDNIGFGDHSQCDDDRPKGFVSKRISEPWDEHEDGLAQASSPSAGTGLAGLFLGSENSKTEPKGTISHRNPEPTSAKQGASNGKAVGGKATSFSSRESSSSPSSSYAAPPFPLCRESFGFSLTTPDTSREDLHATEERLRKYKEALFRPSCEELSDEMSQELPGGGDGGEGGGAWTALSSQGLLAASVARSSSRTENVFHRDVEASRALPLLERLKVLSVGAVSLSVLQRPDAGHALDFDTLFGVGGGSEQERRKGSVVWVGTGETTDTLTAGDAVPIVADDVLLHVVTDGDGDGDGVEEEEDHGSEGWAVEEAEGEEGAVVLELTQSMFIPLPVVEEEDAGRHPHPHHHQEEEEEEPAHHWFVKRRLNQEHSQKGASIRHVIMLNLHSDCNCEEVEDVSRAMH
jgi:hypothetical protein